ncbi:hypothetical protein Pfo_000300 [Paulownia fortunei]|nr:hypothetical protein Pfo_000300 [Paulownia fortunei]
MGMGMVMLQVLGLVLKVCAFACSFVIQESAGLPSLVSNANMFISIAPTPIPQPKGLASSPWPSIPSVPPPYLFVPPQSVEDTVPAMPPIPPGKPHLSEHPPSKLEAPAPIILPPNKQTVHPSAPGSVPRNSQQTKGHDNNAPVSPISPVSNVASPRIMPESPPPSHSVLPEEPPSLPPERVNQHSLGVWWYLASPLINEVRDSNPELLTKQKEKCMPASHAKTYDSAQLQMAFIVNNQFFFSTSGRYYDVLPCKRRKNIPFVSPKKFPSGSSPRNPKMPLLPPLQALPPPPPHKDCVTLTCTEPLTYGHPESSCVCVLPIHVGLRLTVALYTFFPLVSELAAEIAAGVFMEQSQVRVMGANAAGDDPEKTIVLIDLVPLREKFDDTTVYLTFQRFWHKQVVIKPSFFGDYDVLYVRYPGLPPSPPLPPSTIGIIGTKPYPGHDNNARTLQPLGVDVRRRQYGNGLSRSILATIILSAFVAVVILCVIAWVLLLKTRDCVYQPDPNPTTTIPSLAKSSGMAVSMAGSGPSSTSFSLGSSIAAYNGSAKTFSLSDVEKATDYFNETRILGEGGFGRVYSGVLEDGTKVAMKILKRYDQQGGREFMAEVEMLSRLHHRNLVKLIGICAEDRTRCLVYELIPNGSLESHLHGIDKETAPLDWSARLKVALGAARALAYLHEDSSPPVIHRDFKASNILLEDDFTPKVSDFGLARTALDEENKHISTRVMGTFGYVAPEYAMTGHLLVKSDVYSYGVVLLELLTGRKPVDMSQPPGQENLVSWARPLLTSREGLESIVDTSLGPDFPFDSIVKVAAITSMCVQPEVSHRPFMGEVVQALKLVYNECDEMKELQSRSSSQEEFLTDMEARKSTISDQMPDHLLTQSPVSNFDYRFNVERGLSMSELLSSSIKFGRQDSGTFRRHSSSGPLRTGKAKRLWKMMRRLSGGSMSEPGVQFRLWPGSH